VSEEQTIRKASVGVPVRRVAVAVLRGPDAGREALVDAGSLRVGTAENNELRLTDKTVSRYHLELRRAGARIAVIDHDSTNGVAIGPVLLRNSSALVPPETALVLGDTELVVRDGNVVMLERDPPPMRVVLGDSPAIRELRARAAQLALSSAPVLVLGESGTGKELLARAIHEASDRASGPFVTVDCGAIAPSLFASELFGHERGSFTGADRQHHGAFERAGGGTLFLDEIGELPAEQQAALLGVLERKSFRRVGGERELPADVRIVAATHRDLHAEVNAGRFRSDLFYRIAVVLLDVPPLRDRQADIPLLIEHFLVDLEAEQARALFDAETLRRLSSHRWRGNVRELRNFVHATVALGAPPALRDGPGPGGDAFAAVLDAPFKDAKCRLVEEFERRYLEHLLVRSGGNVRRAARESGMNRSYLIELLDRHGLR
jgi:DNA-binding NtrC family response regulator